MLMPPLGAPVARSHSHRALLQRVRFRCWPRRSKHSAPSWTRPALLWTRSVRSNFVLVLSLKLTSHLVRSRVHEEGCYRSSSQPALPQLLSIRLGGGRTAARLSRRKDSWSGHIDASDLGHLPPLGRILLCCVASFLYGWNLTNAVSYLLPKSFPCCFLPLMTFRAEKGYKDRACI
jgi:hypothetical protein